MVPLVWRQELEFRLPEHDTLPQNLKFIVYEFHCSSDVRLLIHGAQFTLGRFRYRFRCNALGFVELELETCFAANITWLSGFASHIL